MGVETPSSHSGETVELICWVWSKWKTLDRFDRWEDLACFCGDSSWKTAPTNKKFPG